jgi:hypothetical protein
VQDTVRSHVTGSCSLARNRGTSANFARANWLFSFQTTYEAAECMKKQQAFSGKLILKGSKRTDHLERIQLSQIDEVDCWKRILRG